MRRRIVAGMGANSFGMGITIVIQLVSLPFFLYYWNTATYGIWLMLTAIPSYLSMADVGMVTAAGNKMTMAMGRGDVKEANKVFQSAQLFMGLVCGGLGLVALPLMLFAPFPGLNSLDQRLAMSALSVGVIAALFGGLSEQVFKATHRYATGAMLSSWVRLGEWAGFMVGLMLIGTFAGVALCGVAVRLAGTLVGMALARNIQHGLTWGTHAASRSEIRSTMKPALSFMAFPLSNALSFQGVTLLVGILFGPVAVALFNTYRTIARVATQITAIFSHSLWPEFSRLFGHGANSTLNELFVHSAFVSAAQAILLSFVLYFFAPWILQIWTHGAIEYDSSLMTTMLLYAAIGGIWHIPRVLLMATNQHIALAIWSTSVSVILVGLAWIMANNFQLLGIGLAMLTSELLLAVICVWLALRAIHNHPFASKVPP